MAIDFLRAGKAVYCEKPVVQKIEEEAALVAAEKETGNVLQVGSQTISSIATSQWTSLRPTPHSNWSTWVGETRSG